jgi:hypothetical protein
MSDELRITANEVRTLPPKIQVREIIQSHVSAPGGGTRTTKTTK